MVRGIRVEWVGWETLLVDFEFLSEVEIVGGILGRFHVINFGEMFAPSISREIVF